MLRPLISENERSTARRSAPCRSMLIGEPEYFVVAPGCGVGCRTVTTADARAGACVTVALAGVLSRPSIVIGSAARAACASMYVAVAPAPRIALIASVAATLVAGGTTY